MKNITQFLLSVCALVVTFACSALASPPPQPTTPIPEPGTLLLLGIGAAGLIAYKKFKK